MPCPLHAAFAPTPHPASSVLGSMGRASTLSSPRSVAATSIATTVGEDVTRTSQVPQAIAVGGTVGTTSVAARIQACPGARHSELDTCSLMYTLDASSAGTGRHMTTCVAQSPVSRKVDTPPGHAPAGLGVEPNMYLRGHDKLASPVGRGAGAAIASRKATDDVRPGTVVLLQHANEVARTKGVHKPVQRMQRLLGHVTAPHTGYETRA